MLLVIHRRFSRKICPGNWLFGKLGDLAHEVNSRHGLKEAKESVVRVKVAGSGKVSFLPG